MARIILSVVIVLASSLSESSGHGSGNFPLRDCHTGQFDILIVWWAYHEDDFKNEVNDDIRSLFVGSENEVKRSFVSTAKGHINGDFCRFLLSTHNQTEIDVCERIKSKPHVRLDSNNAQSKSLSLIKLASFTFTDMRVGRQNSTRVVILIIDGHFYAYMTIDQIRNLPEISLDEESELKVFLLVHRDGADRYDKLRDNMYPVYGSDILIIPKYSENKYQMISVALCKQCLPGWFSLENNGKVYFFSCYKFDMDDNNIDWYRASAKCQGFHANLVTIESQEELDLVQEQLFQHLLANGQHVISPGVTRHNSASVYIGLKRDSKTVAQRFQWRLYNPARHRPLVLNHWLAGKPDGGFSHACGVWIYDDIYQNKVQDDHVFTNVSAGRFTFSDYKSNNVEGWSDVGCGTRATKVSLCEVALSDNLRDQDVIIINPANEKNFKKASNTNDFQEYKGTIVSVSAFVNNEKFKTFLKDNDGEFPLFDCGADAGDSRYIPYSYVCDGLGHCRNGHDENVCLRKACNTSCRSGQCIPDGSKCDIFNDCDDGSDEQDCEPCFGMRSCDGTCLPVHVYNDGHTDCM